MADDSTDSAFGFILFILFLALLGYAAGGISSSSSTAGTTGGTSPSLPPLTGTSQLPSGCPSTFTATKTLVDQTSKSSTHSLNLKVWKDPMDPGNKCATATVTPSPNAPTTPTSVKLTLAYTSDPTQMVTGMGTSTGGDTSTASVQVTGTDNICLSANAVAQAGGPPKITITKVDTSCQMTVTGMDQAGQTRVFHKRSDDREIEEGY